MPKKKPAPKKAVKKVTVEQVRPTAHKEIGYVQDGPKLWRMVDESNGPKPDGTFPRIGKQYATRSELLADIENVYQSRFGSPAVEVKAAKAKAVKKLAAEIDGQSLADYADTHGITPRAAADRLAKEGRKVTDLIVHQAEKIVADHMAAINGKVADHNHVAGRIQKRVANKLQPNSFEMAEVLHPIRVQYDDEQAIGIIAGIDSEERILLVTHESGEWAEITEDQIVTIGDRPIGKFPSA